MTKLLHLEEVAERLHRTPSQLRWMLHKGEGPKSALIMRRRVFRESDVEAWIDEQFEKASV